MDNPWKEVALSDYENHMSLSNVGQLQTLDMIMAQQFSAYPVKSVVILGVAGGNGLGNLAAIPSIEAIYGVDINAGYLEASSGRYPQLKGRYTPVLADINADCSHLPSADMVIANLFIEYVGCDNFVKAVKKIDPGFISCVIQVDPAESFVSDSPYTEKLEALSSVHDTVDADLLTEKLGQAGYTVVSDSSTPLPNGKIFRRIDYSLS